MMAALLLLQLADASVRVTALEIARADVTLRTGMVGLPGLSAINGTFRRAGPSGAEAAGLLSGSSLGSTLTVAGRLGEISGGVYQPNGFGRALGGARLWLGPFEGVRLLASTEQSLDGVRHVTGATFRTRFATIGVDRSWARGIGDDRSREASAVGGFVTLTPLRRLDTFLRYDVVARDVEARLFSAGLAFRGPSTRFARGVDLLAAYQRVDGRTLVPGAIDGLTTQRTVRLDVSVRF